MMINNCEGVGVTVENVTIYMDNSATTPVRKEVVEDMILYLTENFGNPSSIHDLGKTSKHAIENARKKVAKTIGSEEYEVYFTSGGTESNNWVIKGVAFANRNKGKHIITSSIEHHSVLHACEWLEGQEFEVTYLPVDKYGMVFPEELKNAIRDDTILISIMFANNEIGTIQPVEEIGKIARENRIYFHTDAVQAVGHIPIDVNKMNIDLLSLSGHKFQGPKGCGVLYIKTGTKIETLIHGGDQERKRRAGTENVPAIVGLGKAIELATGEIEKSNQILLEMRKSLIKGLIKIPKTHLNGHPTQRLASNINVTVEYIEGKSLLLMLNAKGIFASTRDTFNSSSLKSSHLYHMLHQ